MSTIKTTHLQHPSASSPNLTLAADGSVSGGAGLGGLVHIATESFSGVSSVSLDNVFSSTYSNYRIVGYLPSASVADALWFRLRASGSDASGSDYRYAQLGLGHTGSTANDFAATSRAPICVYSTSQSSFSADIYHPALANQTMATNQYGYLSSTWTFRQGGFVHNVATVYDGFTISAGSGNFTGTLRVYGYANS